MRRRDCHMRVEGQRPAPSVLWSHGGGVRGVRPGARSVMVGSLWLDLAPVACSVPQACWSKSLNVRAGMVAVPTELELLP